MKKITLIAAFALLFIGLQAQTLEYSIECPKPDSCFLKEISTAAPTAQEPRPQSTVSWRFFRTFADLDTIIELIRKQAREEAAKGMELMKKSEEGMELMKKSESMNAIAEKINAAKSAKNN